MIYRIVFFVFCLIVLQTTSAQLQASVTHAEQQLPEQITVRWLEPGQLLLRWRQLSNANRVIVYSCPTKDVMTCSVVAELQGEIQGVRTATVWGQPGQYTLIGEFRADTSNIYNMYGWTEPIEIPTYPIFLPVVK